MAIAHDGQRFWPIVFACAGAMLISYVDRVSISVAGLAMQREFGWSEATKGMVLSSFFVGYLCVQVFGGWLAHRFGGRRVLLAALIFWSVCMVLTPAAASAGMVMLLAFRVLLGVGEGPLNPAAFAVIGRWVPEEHRAQATSLYASASFLGTVIALAGVAWLTTQAGWRAVYYVCGAAGVVYAAFAPKVIPSDGADDSETRTARSSVPWRALLTIRPFWALTYAFSCTNWIFYVLLLWMPSYFVATFKLGLLTTGLLSLIPWLVMFAMINLAGWGADRALRGGLDTTLVRKAWAGAGLLIAAAALFAIPLAQTPVQALVAFCIALGGIAIAYASHSPNTYDLAPGHAHILYSVMNTFGSLPGVFGIAATGLLVAWSGSYGSALTIAGAIAASGALVFLLGGSGESHHPASPKLRALSGMTISSI